MKNNLLRKCAAIVLGFTMLCSVSAFAASNPADLKVAPEKTTNFIVPDKELGPEQIFGTITKLETGSLNIKNSNEGARFPEFILHLSEQTLILDAVSGLPVAISDLKDGDTIYAYAGPAMTMSLPPQATAIIILCNISDNATIPHFFEIQSILSDSKENKLVSTDDATNLRITPDCKLFPFLTKNVVTAENLVPGTKVLAWYDIVALSYPAQAAPTKIMIFPYDQAGYAELTEDGVLYVNGQKLNMNAKTKVYKDAGGTIMLPLRAICEEVGYQVVWSHEDKAVTVSTANGTILLKITPEFAESPINDDKSGLIVKTQLIDGTTYIPLNDLELLLNVAVGQKY